MSTVSPFAVGVPFADNPRQVSKKRLDALRSSLADLGELGGVVHDLNSDQIISGNQHMRAIGKRGVRVEFIDEEHAPDAQGTVRVGFITWPGGSIPYRQVRWDAGTCQRANIVANTDAGFWNWDALAGWDAEQLQEWGLDAEQLTAWNNDAANLGALLAAEGQGEDGSETGADDDAPVDRAEELQEKWAVRVGDLWRIGEHVLICGDCREQETWERLLGVAGVGKVNGVFTSPPYAEQRKEQYGGVPVEKYVEWWNAVQSCVRGNLAADGSFFVNIKPHCENGQRVLYVFDLVLAMAREWGWRFVDELCWKNPGVPGEWENRFKDGFEPVYHFSIEPPEWWRPIYEYMLGEVNKVGWGPQDIIEMCGVGMFGHWFTESQFQIPTESHYNKIKECAGGQAFLMEFDDLFKWRQSIRISTKFRPHNVSYISDYCVKGRGGSPITAIDGHSKVALKQIRGMSFPDNVIETGNSSATGHSAAFPVSLPDFFIRAYSDPGDSWCDPFSGSGTTIVAAHKNNRRGLGIELLPKYCAVTLERMATAFPDLTIERVGAED